MHKTIIPLLEELIFLKEENAKHKRNNGLKYFDKKHEFYNVKFNYNNIKIKNLVEKIQKNILDLSQSINNYNSDNELILKIISIAKVRDKIYENPKEILEKIKQLDSNNTKNKIKSDDDKSYLIEINKLNLPKDIKSEILADISELNKCFLNKCYRACVILCGRILEVSLHRKYYEHTNVDLLEKTPGIGIGKLVAKMSEKEIKLDPGIMQQIHLINNVRIYSVHKKTIPFSPSKIQCQAIILYTKDILKKLFK